MHVPDTGSIAPFDHVDELGLIAGARDQLPADRLVAFIPGVGGVGDDPVLVWWAHLRQLCLNETKESG